MSQVPYERGLEKLCQNSGSLKPAIVRRGVNGVRQMASPAGCSKPVVRRQRQRGRPAMLIDA